MIPDNPTRIRFIKTYFDAIHDKKIVFTFF